MLETLERKRTAMIISTEMRDKLYGGPQIFPELLTPEMERRVRDSLRVVNLEHAGAGRKRDKETLALKVFDELAMLHGRGVLNDEQRYAGEKLQRDFWSAGLESVQAIDYRADKVDFKRKHHDDAVTSKLDDVDRYVRAIQVIPRKCWPVVRDIVLGENRIDSVRLKGLRARKLKRLKLITLLEIGLDALAEFYGFDERQRRRHAKMLDNEARPTRENFGSSAVVHNDDKEP